MTRPPAGWSRRSSGSPTPPFEDVKAKDAVGRIAAEQITSYPPGIPVILPGERINQEVVDYLLSGLDAGRTLPDPADPSLKTIRVMQ